MTTRTLDITGASLTGSDGTANRTYTFPYSDVQSSGMQIFANGVYLHQGVGKDYTVSSNIITFLNAIYNFQIISGTYITGATSSQDVDYCLIQDVYDELDGKTSTDISEDRVISAIQQAEGLIDLKTGTSFKVITVTDEVHTGDRYSLDVSPDYLDTLSPMVNSRRDSIAGRITNRVRTDYSPVISITSLSVNQAGGEDADDWTLLTQQTGSSGDYVLEDAESGIIDFLDQYPRLGKRSWKVSYTYGYNPDSTDRRVLMIVRVVKRLTVLLACRQIITAKSTGSMFDSTRDVKIGTIEIKSGASSTKSYLSSIDVEIQGLWKELEDFGFEVV